MGILFILILVFGVLRPLLGNIMGTNKSKELQVADSSAADGSLDDLDAELAEDTLSLGSEQLQIMLPSPTEGYDAQLTAIKNLLAEDPGRVAQVVKEWINSDE